MILHTALLLGALVTLAQSKAVVTNNCKYDVYAWSIPNNKGYALNRIITSHGGQYSEPFHKGTRRDPGITIKLSPEPNGIYHGKDELDFAYAIDKLDPSFVWVDLNNARGDPFAGNVTFYTCFGAYVTPQVPARKCTIYDQIELVLCGGARQTSEVDPEPESIPRHAGPITGHRLNDTSFPVAPKPHKQLWNKTHSVEERQEKTQQSRPAHPPDTDQLECGCAWYDDGYKCDCEHSTKAHTCITTGAFRYCYSNEVAKKTGNPKAFADKYAKPLLQTMWTYACEIAEIHHWDCNEFKSALKDAFPEIGKTHSAIEQGKVIMSLPSRRNHAERKRAGDDAQICLNLESLFRHEFDTFDCNEIYKDIKIKYGNQRVYLGRKKMDYAPGYNSSDMLAEFERKYPDINWTSDEELESLKKAHNGTTTAMAGGNAKSTARGT
ncbi:uncharacterized protein EI97DRAFT_311675 [Westerdykella ornata]|uniref:Uncharacterized protein n=1 Tax=Westerdykella ornata TaxID=318751 RepID=A0A6A6JKX8_WESOR|nr:uncharacterized protein EI97DRAFT_311675 [Westerdykella ornata]KAF2277167.1 hypothetical protein EI97DRAFT_311675 [Westerdykella ornata]